VRPGGLKNEDNTYPIVMSSADTLFEGSIPRQKVAHICVESLFQPAAQNKIVEILDLYYNIIENNNKNIKNYEETKNNLVYAYTVYTEKQKLGNVCNINQGTMLTKIKMINGIYDVIGGGKIIGKHNITNRNGNDIILTRVGEININFIDKGISIAIITNSANGEFIFKELLETLIGDTFTPWKWEGYFPIDYKK
jgi:hypothetical protein